MPFRGVAASARLRTRARWASVATRRCLPFPRAMPAKRSSNVSIVPPKERGGARAGHALRGHGRSDWGRRGRAPVDRLEVAIEQTRHLPRVRRADQQGQRHSSQFSPSLGGLRIDSESRRGPPSRVLSGGSRLRSAASACRCPPRHLARAVVAEIGGLGPTTRVRVRDTHGRTFTFVDFLSTIVTNENRLPC